METSNSEALEKTQNSAMLWEMWIPRMVIVVCMLNLIYFNKHLLNVLCTEKTEHFSYHKAPTYTVFCIRKVLFFFFFFA